MGKKRADITAFIDKDGKVKQVPSSSGTKMRVMAYMAERFEENRIYNEKEVNEIINQWHNFGDYFILRRLLIDYKFLARTPNGEKYWKMGRTEENETNSGH